MALGSGPWQAGHCLGTPNPAPSLLYPCLSEVTVSPSHRKGNSIQVCTRLVGKFLLPSPASTTHVSSDRVNPFLGYIPIKFPDLTCSLSHQQALPTPPLMLTYTISSDTTELFVIPQHQSHPQSVPSFCPPSPPPTASAGNGAQHPRHTHAQLQMHLANPCLLQAPPLLPSPHLCF